MNQSDKLYVLFIYLCFVVTVHAQDYRPEAADTLPIPGKWQGQQQCVTLGRDTTLPASGLVITVRQNELLSEYTATGRGNSKFVRKDQGGGMTSESPDFIRSLMAATGISEKSRGQLEYLASVLEGDGDNLIPYKLIPDDNVVSGRMICNAEEKWCHFEATLRVRFGKNAFDVRGGDMLQDMGDSLQMVGYAFDEYSCAPETCIVVCEAFLVEE